MKRKIKTLKAKIYQYGVRGAFSFYGYKLLKKVAKIEIKKSIFYYLSIEGNINEPSIIFRTLTFEDFEKAKKYGNKKWFSPKKMETLKSRIENPDLQPFGHFDEEILSCYAWINFGQNKIGKIILDKNDCYFFDDYTDPKFRGRGYQKEMIKYRIIQASKHNRNRVWVNVYSYNRASKNNYLNTGFIPAIKLTTIIFRNGKVKNLYKYLI